MGKKLKYPVGSKILWCEEEYEVLENYNDYSGKVKIGNDIINNFYFNYDGYIDNNEIIDSMC